MTTCRIAPPRLARNPRLSANIERELHERLFAPNTYTIAGAITVVSETAIGFMETGQRWFIMWGVASVVVMLGRMLHEWAYRRRCATDRSTVPWRRWYFVGACVNGLLCGIGGAAALNETGNVCIMLFGVWNALVYGAAIRNALYPAAAKAFIGCAQLPCIAVTLMHPDFGHVPFLLLNVLFFGVASGVARTSYRQTVDFLRVEEERATLVQSVQRSNDELAAANARLATMAMVDGLTGVPNRRAFDEALQAASRAAERDGDPMSILLIDIDFFKKYNDRYGHQAGDSCLQRVAEALRASLRRPTDLLARYGGEEFVALLPQTDKDGVAAVGEVARAAVEALGIESDSPSGGVVTVSVGAATSPAETAIPGALLIGEADRALYVAKRAGRNQVASAPLPRFAHEGSPA